MEENKQTRTGPKPKQLKQGTYMGIEVGRGDKKKIIDPNEVEKLASIGMKGTEIAEWFGIDDSTLRYNFKDNISKGKLMLNQSLRRAMINNAITNNNAAVQIFLAKNILGMSDSPTASDDTNILPWSD